MRLVVPVLLSLALAGCSADPAVAPVGASEPPPTSAPIPSAAAPSTGTAPFGTAARAVYWLGNDDRRGPRLYREFVRRPVAADAVRDAVEAMLSGQPKDPDYRSLWARGTTVLGVERDRTTVVVDLSAQARRSGGGSASEAATVQQLVHTVTAAEPALRSVRLLVEGQPVDTLWGAVDTSRPLRRAPAAEVLGPVWLEVEEGATLTGRFGGTATVFEATVSWQLRQGQRVVREGFSTASTGAPGRGDWSAEVDAPAGSYELWAFESSAEDGSITWLDTKRVTLR